eukprot:TRINITY_DN35_c0_g1_i1.p1 TRINITY_DN35_c0_g1~~TRINITY_DN35_c0_g1_i1.p1  ORF type:complete len:268 (+),score=98.97 TRINITY_DN35_c0_g1_i1:52-855(+)
MARYDRAITVFSPSGQLFQIQYALEAVNKGTTAIAIKGKDVIVLGVEKKSTAVLQDSRTVKKIALIDDHIAVAFAGLTADARVLINRARLQAQSHRLTVEDKYSVEGLVRWVAEKQQKMTQSGGVRPYGLSTLIVGFDIDGTGRLFQTDPSGIYSEWHANAVGRNSKTVKEYFEKHYPGIRRTKKEGEEDEGEEEEAMDVDAVPGDMNDEQTIKLAVEALMEVVESPKNIEIATMKPNSPLTYVDKEEIEKIVEAIEESKKAAEEDK